MLTENFHDYLKRFVIREYGSSKNKSFVFKFFKCFEVVF